MCYWLTGIKFVCFFFCRLDVYACRLKGAVQSETTIVPLIIRDCGEATQVGRCQSSEHRINFHRSIEKHSNAESLLSFWTACLIACRNLIICSPCVWADPRVSPFSVFLTILFWDWIVYFKKSVILFYFVNFFFSARPLEVWWRTFVELLAWRSSDPQFTFTHSAFARRSGVWSTQAPSPVIGCVHWLLPRCSWAPTLKDTRLMAAVVVPGQISNRLVPFHVLQLLRFIVSVSH